MAQSEKALQKLLKKPKTFSYKELKSILISIGFKEVATGKTSGSRVAFYHEGTSIVLRLHKPHPGDELKKYQIKDAADIVNAVLQAKADKG